MHIVADKLTTIHTTTLNGQPVARCWEADEEGGFVVVHKIDANGSILIDHEAGETVKEKLFGAVKITDTGRPRY